MMNEMSLQRLVKELCCIMVLLSFLWSASEAMILAASYPAITDSEQVLNGSRNRDAIPSLHHQTPALESSASGSLLSSVSFVHPPDAPSATYLLASELSTQNSDSFLDVELGSTLSLVDSTVEEDNQTLTDETDSARVLIPSETLTSETSLLTTQEADSALALMPSVSLASEASQRTLYEADSAQVLMPSATQASERMSSSESQRIIPEVQGPNNNSPFHTPLMSLLVAPTSPSSSVPQQLAPTTLSDNEASSSLIPPVPTEQPPQASGKKLLMLVLRAEDCSRFSKQDFERMLTKLMARFGFADAVPEVSTARCYSHLSLNLTVDGPNPTLRFNNLTAGSNFTVDVLNRTFRIVKFEKVDLRLERSRPRDKSALADFLGDTVLPSYMFIGFIFGTVAIFLVATACRWYYYRSYQKRLGTHTRLRPEDYTLTPIPRLNNAYSRAPTRASVFSTAYAADHQGVVQPFDTSIVPLEDSSNPRVESAPPKSGLKALDVQNFPGKASKPAGKRVEFKTGGVANPTFQRY